MAGADARQLALEGALNFRDVGGLQTSSGRWLRRGLLFRSDALDRLTETDLGVVARLGLRTVIDLRNARERRSRPDHLPPGTVLRILHLPMGDRLMSGTPLQQVGWLVKQGRSFDGAALLRQQYAAYAFGCARSLGALYRCLAEPTNLPAVVHCTVGKDRTGFTMAALQLLLGVDDEAVMSDYLRSNQVLQPAVPGLIRRLRWISLGRLKDAHLRPLFEAREALLTDVLGEINARYGSLPAWMEQVCGVDPVVQRRLAETLLTSGFYGPE